MDSFIDRLSQKFNSSEIIKANLQADARELEQHRERTKEYDECMQEMRSLNLKNAELSDQISRLASQALLSLDANNAEIGNKIIQLADQALRSLDQKNAELSSHVTDLTDQAIATLREFQAPADDSSLEDFVHKENVKVYRNVQAVIEAEGVKQTESIVAAVTETVNSKPRVRLGVGIYILVGGSILLSVVNTVILLLVVLGKI